MIGSVVSTLLLVIFYKSVGVIILVYALLIGKLIDLIITIFFLIIIKDAKSSKIIAMEMGINKIDIKRRFKADTQELKQYDLEIPKIKGKNLVIQLIQDFKNQEII